MKKLLDSRYSYSSTRNIVQMSSESLAARDAFISKYSGIDAMKPQSCYVCSNEKMRVISEIDRYGFYYPTAVCDRCGNVQQSEYYTEDVLTDFYSNSYRKIYGNTEPQELFEAQRKGKGIDIFKFVSSVCKPRSVLEVGCGAGGILSIFQKNGSEVTGLDFDEDYLSVARQNGIKAVTGSLDQLSSNDKYDLIILSHVLEHITEPAIFLGKLIEHLEDDGVIYIEVPSLNNVSEGGGGYRYDLLRYWQNAHTMHFTVKTLNLLCKKVGLVNIKQTNFIHSCWNKAVLAKEITSKDMADTLSDTLKLLSKIEIRRKGFRAKLIGFRHVVLRLLALIGIKGFIKSIYYRG
ncbi:class I SAM-dependent methyltransferase [Gammaproteobacteria bacterium]|nr:class I SAM-dependent methyltransferase [Gammaproteobacteria bacterium]